MLRRTIRIDGRSHHVDVKRNVRAPAEAPRLVIAGFQPNHRASALLRLCIDSIRLFTTIPYELWVVDNCSPSPNEAWLESEPGINVAFNRTNPREPGRWFKWLRERGHDPHAASYANGIALELGAAIIDSDSHYMVTLHQDTLACDPQWLQHLLGKMNARCRAAGVRLDTVRVPALHVLGMVFDFQLFRELNLSFRHDLPRYDVGDAVSLGFTRAGHSLEGCSNTHVNPELVEQLPLGSRFRSIHADRVLDDHGHVIFMHLGRGTLKSLDGRAAGKTSVEEWLQFGRRLLDDRNPKASSELRPAGRSPL